MEDWKRSFVQKLGKAQSQWVKQFEQVLDGPVATVFKDLAEFVRHNGFQISTPLRETGRRSFKFELAENAYVLLIFRSLGISELELRTELFVPGREPNLSRSAARVQDASDTWAREQFQAALDRFVELLGGSGGVGGRENSPAAKTEELVSV